MTSKNWKDLDLARDRGIKTAKKKSALEERAEKLASKSAKAELEKLFKESPLQKDKVAELDRVKKLRGTADFYKAMNAYVEKFGMPLEWEVQQLFLDHKDPEFVIRIMDELLKSAPKFELDRQQLLGQKLKVMEVSTFDRKLLDKINELKKALLLK